MAIPLSTPLRYHRRCGRLLLLAAVMLLPSVCTNPSEPLRERPALSVMQDTTVAVRDSARLHAHAQGADELRYEWKLDPQSSTTDTTPHDTITTWWDTNETGLHQVAVRALQGEGPASVPETILVDVHLYPPVVTAPRDTLVWIADTIRLRAHAFDTNGTISGYHWFLDSTTLPHTTSAPLLVHSWQAIDFGPHTLRLVALDDDGVRSSVDSFTVTVLLGNPTLTTMADTTVAVNDTVILHASASDPNGTIQGYAWSAGETAIPDTTIQGLYHLSWVPNDTGRHPITVRAFDDDGLASETDTIFVDVRNYAPVLSPGPDTVVAINDTISLQATARDTNGEIVEYRWSIDSARDTTTQSSMALCWGLADTGVHQITVHAIDDDGFSTAVDTQLVHVLLCAPRLFVGADTTVAIYDSLTLHATAFDSNGVIEHYGWRLDNREPDTTAEGTWPLAFSPGDTGRRLVSVRAFDDDGIATNTDSIQVSVHLYAPVLSSQNDTIVPINDTIRFSAAATDTNGSVRGFIWTLDSSNASDTTNDGRFLHCWGASETGTHQVVVRAFDDDTIFSAPDTMSVTVRLFEPSLSPPSHIFVPIYDTININAAASDTNGEIVAYIWELDGIADTTTRDSVSYAFAMQDTGTHLLRMTVIDDDNQRANDSCVLTVQRLIPQLSFAADTFTTYMYDSLTLSVDARDTNGTVQGVLWWFDGAGGADTTATTTLSTFWSPADSGEHLVAARAIDDDTLLSNPDTAVIVVSVGRPVLDPLPDTLISPSDTLSLAISATDPNGTIDMVYLDRDAGGWDDSGSIGAPMQVIYDGRRSLRLRVGVRDDDTLFATDSLLVFFFNIPPTGVALTAPGDSLFVWDADTNRTEWPATFAFNATDPDGPDDSLVYRLAMGPDAQSLGVAYQGHSSTPPAVPISPGATAWQLVVTDDYGESDTATGVLHCLRETRVCFVGHSIVAGTGGDYVNGGFRRGILDSLTRSAGPFERIRAVGTMRTNWLTPARDDSCLARSSATSHEIFDTLRHSPTANADYWIIMLGVNGNYNYWEQLYSRLVIDSLYARNPWSETYFLNGLAIPDTLTNPQPTDSARDYFNTLLDTLVSVRFRAGRQVYVVDAFTTLSVDSVFNDSLFTDYLHPNQQGYERLTEAIWDRMQNH